jgi:hypothetical protein
MRKPYMLLALILAIFLSLPLVVMGQEGTNEPDPFLSDPDNLCNEGEDWAGQCDSPEMNADQQAWAWKCGWYFARIESGLFQPNDLSDTILSNCVAFLEIVYAQQKTPKVVVVVEPPPPPPVCEPTTTCECDFGSNEMVCTTSGPNCETVVTREFDPVCQID